MANELDLFSRRQVVGGLGAGFAALPARKRGMLRESRIEEIPERICEIASAIAEEGLRYVSDATPGYRRKRSGTNA
jgi:hypothetical protein